MERRCQDISREIQMLNKRQENFQTAIEGKLRADDDRASETMQDQIVEEINKRAGTQKDRRSLTDSGLVDVPK